MRKLKLISIILLCAIMATGCWDKIEIEERAFVLSLGIDKAPANGGDSDKYLITLVNPDTAEAKEGKVLDFVTYDTIAPSYTTGVVQLLQRFSKIHSYEHTKVLIFGEELLMDATLVKDIMDAFNRGHQFNSSMLIFMTQGQAADIFKVKPKMKSLLAYYITGIADNEKIAARVEKLTFLEFMKQLVDTGGDAVIPSLDPTKDGMTISYLGIMKDFKHIAHMSEKEAIAYRWLNDKAKGGVIELMEGAKAAPFTYSTFKTKINLDKVEGRKIYLTYHMETEGSIEEYVLGGKLNDEEKLKSLELGLEEIIEKDCKALIKKLQQEFKVDLLGVREYLYKHHAKLYETIEKDYQEYFERNIVINVKSDAKVRRVGKSE